MRFGGAGFFTFLLTLLHTGCNSPNAHWTVEGRTPFEGMVQVLKKAPVDAGSYEVLGWLSVPCLKTEEPKRIEQFKELAAKGGANAIILITKYNLPEELINDEEFCGRTGSTKSREMLYAQAIWRE